MFIHIIKNRLSSIKLFNYFIFKSKNKIIKIERNKNLRKEYNSLTTNFDRIQYRIMYGRWLRNHYLLWNDNNPYTIIKYNKTKTMDSPYHPDNFSGYIMDVVLGKYIHK